jgi:hypothetical protein
MIMVLMLQNIHRGWLSEMSWFQVNIYVSDELEMKNMEICSKQENYFCDEKDRSKYFNS